MRQTSIVPVSQTTVFLATGAVQTFTVPAGVTAIRFFMWGAGGGNQDGNATVKNNVGGGSGAYLEGNIRTTPGTVYSIIVGRSAVTGLANGGGSTSQFGGGGGGFSGIFSSSPAANTVIAIAGGGGGCGTNNGGSGGGGGFPNGLSGVGTVVTAGGGGTQTAGGTGVTPGSQLAGAVTTAGAGGGGGGWYGGGSGTNAGSGSGGGGGSSTYISSVQGVVSVNGNVGITTTGLNTPAANESSPYWVSPSGRSANNGLVVIGFSQQALPLIRAVNPIVTSPLQISGCVLWLDGADSSTVSLTGSTITQWRDKSGRGYLGAFSSGRNFTYATGIRNNLNVVQTATGQSMTISNFVLGATMSIFHVYMPINQSSGSAFLEQGPNANGTNGFFFHSQANNNFLIRNNNNSVWTNFGTTAVSNTWEMIEGVNKDPNAANTMSYYTNGTLRASGGNTTSDTPVTDTLNLNGRNNTNTLSYNTYIGELIIYNVALSDAQRQQIEGYLAWKWGLASLLPSNHLYRNSQVGPYSLPLTIRFRPYPVAVAARVRLTYSGAYTTVTVPSTASFMFVNMWGAGGGIGFDSTWWGGGGAYIEGYLPVTPGESLRFIVGAAGSRAVTGDVNGSPGFGSASYGGGRTAVQRSISGSFTDVVVAGAGGGAGGGGTGNPGGGGAATLSGIAFAGRSGNNNFLRQTANNGVAGGGGGQSSGGTGGNGNAAGNGAKGQGGSSINNYSGGGGSGWYGGGGGIQNPNDHGSGGGGSSYGDLLINFTGFSGSANIAGNTSSSLWVSPAGNGSTGGAAGDGLLYYQFFASI